MANPHLEGLDEFFDFEQLEHDNSNQNEIQSQELGFAASLSELDSAMDWQPTGLNGSYVFAPILSNLTYDPSMHMSSELDSLNPTFLHETLGNIILAPHNLALDSATQIYPPDHQFPEEASTFDLLPSAVSTGQQESLPTPLKRNPTGTRKPASATRKGASSRIPLEAKQMLEEEFTANPYPCSWEIDIIAHQANLDVKRVRNWFNNTRARKKGSGE
jgi:hypothetical protein